MVSGNWLDHPRSSHLDEFKGLKLVDINDGAACDSGRQDQNW